MTTIQNSPPPTPTITPREDLEAQAASMQVLGGIESTIAQISVQLDELRDSSRQTERRARQQQTGLRRAALGQRRKAARIQLVAGVVGGVVKAGNAILSGAAEAKMDGTESTPASTRFNRAAQGVSAGGDALGAAISFAATRASSRADARDHAAEIVGETAQQLDELQESLERTVEKAMTHLERINEARVQAQMAATRG